MTERLPERFHSRIGSCRPILGGNPVVKSVLQNTQRALQTMWTGAADLSRPLKLERRLVMGRWLGILVFATAFAIHPLEATQTLAAYGVLAIAAVYNLVLLRLLERKHLGLMVSFVPTLGDGLLCAGMIALVGGFDSPYYPVFYAVVVSAGMRLGFVRGMVLAGGIALLDLAWLISQHQGVDAAFIVRSGVLLLTVVLTSFLYDEAQKSEAELNERLHLSEMLNTALEHQALHDLLTDLPNRTLLHRRVQQAILAARLAEGSVALLVIDLDRFKEINDTFGHQYGDVLLREIGPRLADVLGPRDIIARLGGDEFAVLLPRASAVQAEQVARDILAALDAPFVISESSVDVGGSIGIALSPQHGADSDVLLRRADVAMYVAKRAGRGFATYSPDQDQHTPDRLTLVGDLRRAIEADELTLVYQPKVSLSTGQCVGVEALIRWQHPQRGMIPPEEFISLAEHTGLIKLVSRWVVNTALRQSRDWLSHDVNLPIAVNLSMRDLHDPELPETVANLLERWNVPASNLVVEITENGLMADPARALQIITGLRLMGIRIAIDDFGTGYSSLAYLKRLPVDELKIDRSFIRDLATDTDDLAIVRSTISLGHDLGLSIVAEGIEDAATADLLRQLGCDVAQGYFFGRPMSADALVDRLAFIALGGSAAA
jgi:diguanylate cyclase (GGDEF)-like protein